MLKALLWRLKKKRLPPAEEANASQTEPPDEQSPYTEQEAQKVKERLQGLGYID